MTYPASAACPLCGPYKPKPGAAFNICPCCDMDEGEVAYREMVMRLGGAEVYRREYLRDQLRGRR